MPAQQQHRIINKPYTNLRRDECEHTVSLQSEPMNCTNLSEKEKKSTSMVPVNSVALNS